MMITQTSCTKSQVKEGVSLELTRINCGPLDPLAPLTCTLNHIVHPAGLLVKRIYAPQYSYDWVYALTKDGKEYFELAKRFEVGTSAWIKAINSGLRQDHCICLDQGY